MTSTEGQRRYLAQELLSIQQGSVDDALTILYDNTELTDEEVSNIEEIIRKEAETAPDYGE